MKKTLLLLMGIISIFAITACKNNKNKETIPIPGIGNPVAQSSADEVKNAILSTYSFAGQPIEKSSNDWQNTGNEEIRITEVVEGDTIKLVIETRTTGNASGNIVSRSIMANESSSASNFKKVIITFYANGKIEKQEFTKDSEDASYESKGEAVSFTNNKEDVKKLKDAVVEAVVPQEIKEKSNESVSEIKEIMIEYFIRVVIDDEYDKESIEIDITKDELNIKINNDEKFNDIELFKINFEYSENGIIATLKYDATVPWFADDNVPKEFKDVGDEILDILEKNGFNKITNKYRVESKFEISIKKDKTLNISQFFISYRYNSLIKEWIWDEKGNYNDSVESIEKLKEFLNNDEDDEIIENEETNNTDMRNFIFAVNKDNISIDLEYYDESGISAKFYNGVNKESQEIGTYSLKDVNKKEKFLNNIKEFIENQNNKK